MQENFPFRQKEEKPDFLGILRMNFSTFSDKQLLNQQLLKDEEVRRAAAFLCVEKNGEQENAIK